MINPIRCLVADPPWTYTDKKAGMRKTGKGAASHYRCLPIDEIKEYLNATSWVTYQETIPLAEAVDHNAHLWLWVTNAFLVDGTGSDVCHAWGFKPKTIITWVKGRIAHSQLIQHIGQGSYLRNSTEHVMFAVRGSCPPNVRSLPTAFIAPRTMHSQKPDLILDWAERLSPGPRLELFARRHRTGWLAVGDELETIPPGSQRATNPRSTLPGASAAQPNCRQSESPSWNCGLDSRP